jgi:hypothetical protein
MNDATFKLQQLEDRKNDSGEKAKRIRTIDWFSILGERDGSAAKARAR